MSNSKYTYTIFDSNPNSSSGTEWPTHVDMEIEAASDAEAIEEVRDVMSTEASGLNTSDGYAVGNEIHAIVWSEDGTIVGQPRYELTHEDLGVETDEERLARAAKHIDATKLDDGRWAHYAEETSRWHVVDDSELAELCDYLDSDDQSVSNDAYSHWCAGTSSEEMPEGWEPGDDIQKSDEDDLVTIEEMPDYLRGSHRAAGNWGSYPHNGATRRKVSQQEADEIIESDPEYAHVVGA